MSFLTNLIERSAWTFVEAGVAVILAEQAFSMDAMKVAVIAGGLAVCKVVMVAAAARRKQLES